MKKFIINIVIWIGIPLGACITLYLFLDPFRVVHPFDISYFMEQSLGKTNREYLSFHLYENNKSTQQYNSFIIGSSRTCALNSYQWKKYLGEDATPFIWTSWRENILGIRQKIEYLDREDTDIKNVLVVLDCGEQYSFNLSNGEAPLTNHYYKLSAQSAIRYQIDYFCAFLSKPTKIGDFIKDYRNINSIISIDTLTNDSYCHNDTIQQCPQNNKANNLDPKKCRQESILPTLITPKIENEFWIIHDILLRHKTQYKILICPNFYNWKLNPMDLTILYNIFGETNIYDYSGVNKMAFENYHYSDIEHFNTNVGWRIIEDMYAPQ